MTITRSHLLELNENQLRENVLIPMFKNMGFKDVYSYHGGSQEQGKDIVMWKADNLGCRVNYAVIVKAQKITGKASRSNSAAEVRFQVEQCFSEPYEDPVEPKTRNVGYCFIVCSHEIKKEFRAAINGPLENSNLDKLIRYIHGDGLLANIQQYLPEITVAEKLEDSRQILASVNSNYMVTAKIEENGVKYKIKPKHSDVEKLEPLKFDLQLSLPETPEDKKVLEAFKKHINTGAPVTLTKPYIKKLKYPDFLKQFIEPIGKGVYEITMGPITSPEPFLAKIEFESDDGNIHILDYIDFKRVQVGKDEFTIDNNHQQVPWKIKVIFNSKNKQIKISYNFYYKNVNVNRVLKGFHFQRALAKGGTHKIIDLDTGFVTNTLYIKKGHFPDLEDSWFEVIEKLVFIQEKTSTLLKLPPGGVKPEVMNIILRAAYIMEKGSIIGRGKKIQLNMDRDNAEEFLRNYMNGDHGPATFKREETFDIFGIPFHMGLVSINLKKFLICSDDIEKLKSEISSSKKLDTYQLNIQLDENEDIKMFYHKWLPPEKRQQLPTLLQN